MNLLRVGNRALNLDAVAMVNLGRAEPEPGDLVRVFFLSSNEDGQLSHVDFTGAEADRLRTYLAHHADDLGGLREHLKTNE